MKTKLQANCVVNRVKHLVTFSLEFIQNFDYDPETIAWGHGGFQDDDGNKMLDLWSVKVDGASLDGQEVELTEEDKIRLTSKVWINIRSHEDFSVCLFDEFQALAENEVIEAYWTAQGPSYYSYSEEDKTEHLNYTF